MCAGVCARRKNRSLRVPGKVPARDLSKCFWNIVPPGDRGGLVTRGPSRPVRRCSNERKHAFKRVYTVYRRNAQTIKISTDRVSRRKALMSINSSRIEYFGHACTD